jgi:heat shock protein HslJ
MRKLLILILTAIPLIGCSSGNRIQCPNGAWVMYRMSGIELNENQLMKGLPVFRFDLSENRFSGHAGCNQMMSGITISEGEIKFGLIMRTEMACPHMEVEDAVLKVLSENTLKYDVKDSVLTLTSSDGTVMQFKRDESD